MRCSQNSVFNDWIWHSPEGGAVVMLVCSNCGCIAGVVPKVRP
jgi:hypothetical protein